MTTIITIETYPSMPGRYRVRIGGRHIRDAWNPGEAAAAAVNASTSAKRPWLILGESKALGMIPAEARQSK